MATKLATRPASHSMTRHMPAFPPDLTHLPLGTFAFDFPHTRGRPGRKGKITGGIAMTDALASDVHMAMLGRLFLMETLHLLGALFNAPLTGATFAPGRGRAGALHKVRAPWGSKTRNGKAKRGRRKAT